MMTLNEMDMHFLPALSRTFTPTVINSLTRDGFSPYLTEVCLNFGLSEKTDPLMTVGDFFDEVYQVLTENYRSEYIFKNVIINNLLHGKHSLNTSKVLTEFRIANNKADVIILNGTSTVYEIKSEYDTFSRLQNQIAAYLEVFDYINVITSPLQASKIKSVLPNNVGILVLTKLNEVLTIREALSNKENCNPSILFNSLRKSEYIRIIKEHYGFVPDVPNTMIFNECKKLFCQIPAIEAHDLTIEVLKERTNTRALKVFMKAAPRSLSAYGVSICDQERRLMELLGIINHRIEPYLSRKQLKPA